MTKSEERQKILQEPPKTLQMKTMTPPPVLSILYLLLEVIEQTVGEITVPVTSKLCFLIIVIKF